MKIYFYWYNVNIQEELLIKTEDTIPSIRVRDDEERGIPHGTWCDYQSGLLKKYRQSDVKEEGFIFLRRRFLNLLLLFC